VLAKEATTSADAKRGRNYSRRRSQIVELVKAQGWARIDDLADQFGVSTMTIHRDLDHLDSQGMLRKVRSGAEAPPSEAFERSVDLRRTSSVVEKEAVANAGFAWAAERVEMQAVALDDSTTALHVLPRLVERLPLTVVTNFLPVINELAADPRVRLHAIGGDYVADFASFIGTQAMRALEAVHYDVLFMSVPAVARGMCFHPSSAAADLKLAFMESAELRVLLIDHTKTTRRAVYRICGLSHFDAVVVDDRLDASEIERLGASGANVVVAPTPGGPRASESPPAGESAEAQEEVDADAPEPEQ
jgi:DeoR/GlpR family transcriptional regulator of sugar metabolism